MSGIGSSLPGPSGPLNAHCTCGVPLHRQKTSALPSRLQGGPNTLSDIDLDKASQARARARAKPAGCSREMPRAGALMSGREV